MSKRSSAFDLWFNAAAAANDAALTITMRMMKAQAAILSGDLTGGAETRHLVSEKAIAAGRGYWRGAFALADLMMMAPPMTAAAFWSRAFGVVSESTAPGYRKARANARRLTRFR